jgi:hypothetical protein
VPPDREEATIGETPEVVVEDMSDVTDRLGDRLWMIAPLTAGVVDPDPNPTANAPTATAGPGAADPVTE